MQFGNNKTLKIVIIVEILIGILLVVALIIFAFLNKQPITESSDNSLVETVYDPITSEYLYDDTEIEEGDDGPHEKSAIDFLGFADFVGEIGQEGYNAFISSAREYISQNYPETTYISLDVNTLICDENSCRFNIYLNSKKALIVRMNLASNTFSYEEK